MTNQPPDFKKEDFLELDLELIKKDDRWQKYYRLLGNALSAIPWVGSLFSTMAARHGERVQSRVNDALEEWLKVHKDKIYYLMRDLDELAGRLENVAEELTERIQSDEYMSLVRRAFKSWNDSETQEKREYIINLIANAAATKLCPDDMVRLFNDWIDRYHEAHFKVIRCIYQNPGTTRGNIWDIIAGTRPREDSPDADLYRLLIRDLSTGGVIRQSRTKTYDGQFLKKTGPRAPKSSTMESAFEDTKPYELTGLGSQFVHYTMNKIVKRIGA